MLPIWNVRAIKEETPKVIRAGIEPERLESIQKAIHEIKTLKY